MKSVSSRIARSTVNGFALSAIALALAACGGGGDTQVAASAPLPPAAAGQPVLHDDQ